MSTPITSGQIWPNGGGTADLGIADLNDVDLTSLTDADILVWDDVTGKWVNMPNSSGGGSNVVGATWDNGAQVLNLSGTTKVVAIAKASGTISAMRVSGDGTTGSATIGVKKCALASFPGSLADITGGNDVVLTSVATLDDTTLTGWTTTVVEGDRFEFELKSVSGFKQLTIIVEFA